MIIEVCAESYESAINAELGGADRIELCKDLHLDGLTPDFEIAKKTINTLKIPVFILIRPREGDFVYSKQEYELMKADIVKFKEMGCKGIVSGILKSDDTIDLIRTKELIELSMPLEFTFHRAFDKTPNSIEGMEQLINIGVNRILTSGKENTAIEGIELIKKLFEISQNRIKIMPGGGISPLNSNNFKSIGIDEIHGSFSKDGINTLENIKNTARNIK